METIHLPDMVGLMKDTPAQRFPFGGQILLRRGQGGTGGGELGDGGAVGIEFSRAVGPA